MRFSTYANAVAADDPSPTTIAGTANRGELLDDVLRRSEGRYEVVILLSDKVREELRRMAELTSDSQLLTTAGEGEVRVSLEHLRQHDPSSTRITYGFTVEREPGDGGLEEFER